jgi:2',3'-cyclic-nucleotide 2'-phosphodiesterase
MRILFIGDVVGKAGMSALSSFLPPLLSRWNVDVTIVNGENSADAGFGITRDTYRAIRDAGADAVTLGNHSWNRKEALEVANQESCLIRPINYVPGTPGSGLGSVPK